MKVKLIHWICSLDITKKHFWFLFRLFVTKLEIPTKYKSRVVIRSKQEQKSDKTLLDIKELFKGDIPQLQQETMPAGDLSVRNDTSALNIAT